MKKVTFSYRALGDFVAFCDERTITVVCVHAWHVDHTEEDVLDQLVKEFRTCPHCYEGKFMACFLCHEANQKGLLADMAGGLEKICEGADPFKMD